MRVAFYTFGCRLNQSETAAIEQGFIKDGHDIVDYRESPDVVVVNTCTVTENGDADTRRLTNKISKKHPNARIALVGCQAQVQKEQLLKLPNVQWVVGNARKMDMHQIVSDSKNAEPQLITPTIRKQSFTIPFVGYDSRHTRANLKVQDGCDFFCSFCEIPYARGRARSREFDDILIEANALTAAGHHELILTGINIGTYDYEGKTLVDVLDALEVIDDLWRIRISSIEPTTIPDAIIERMVGDSKLCRYLHVPLQAGTDEILSAMRRIYTVEAFCQFIDTVYRAVPDVCLGTDVIVGFPGETDELFEQTYQLLLDLPLAYFHVFSYSERDHARSSKMNPALRIDRKKIAERSKRLRELSDRKRRVYNQQFIGKEAHVLFESKKNGWWNGVTDTYVRVKVESQIDLKNQLLPVSLEIEDRQSLTGSLIL
ncbi:MAG: tRNA (N(6)-L-threonylcarbamoyladenosine(37)-C(2))-methylthiotransferase MtaB [Calditrichia bacterium]